MSGVTAARRGCGVTAAGCGCGVMTRVRVGVDNKYETSYEGVTSRKDGLRGGRPWTEPGRRWWCVGEG